MSLFNIWVAEAKQRYPDFLFQENNDTLLNDVLAALAKSLELVWQSKNQTKHNTPGWPVEFVLNNASSILNTRWSQEYVLKQMPEYKDLFFLQSITNYLKIDALAMTKVKTLYNHFINTKTIITEENATKNENIIDLAQYKKDKQPNNAFQNKIVTYLESLFFEKHILLFGDILKNKPPFALSDFCNTDEIEQLIEYVKERVSC